MTTPTNTPPGDHLTWPEIEFTEAPGPLLRADRPPVIRSWSGFPAPTFDPSVHAALRGLLSPGALSPEQQAAMQAELARRAFKPQQPPPMADESFRRTAAGSWSFGLAACFGASIALGAVLVALIVAGFFL